MRNNFDLCVAICKGRCTHVRQATAIFLPKTLWLCRLLVVSLLADKKLLNQFHQIESTLRIGNRPRTQYLCTMTSLHTLAHLEQSSQLQPYRVQTRCNQKDSSGFTSQGRDRFLQDCKVPQVDQAAIERWPQQECTAFDSWHTDQNRHTAKTDCKHQLHMVKARFHQMRLMYWRSKPRSTQPGCRQHSRPGKLCHPQSGEQNTLGWDGCNDLYLPGRPYKGRAEATAATTTQPANQNNLVSTAD